MQLWRAEDSLPGGHSKAGYRKRGGGGGFESGVAAFVASHQWGFVLVKELGFINLQ